MKARSIGRPPLHFSEEDLEKVQSLASRGLTNRQIAYSFGMSESTLYEKQREFPELKERMRRGRAAGVGEVASKLYELAMTGHYPAMAFYLKTRGGWSETKMEPSEDTEDWMPGL
jgi:hypothetical protein